MTDWSGAGDLEELHGAILEAWNRQDEQAYAGCFTDDAVVIGFDGSEMHGSADIAEQVRRSSPITTSPHTFEWFEASGELMSARDSCTQSSE